MLKLERTCNGRIEIGIQELRFRHFKEDINLMRPEFNSNEVGHEILNILIVKFYLLGKFDFLNQ